MARTPVPFAGRSYRPDTRELRELSYRRGMSEADAVRRRGDESAQMISGIGQIASGALSQWANYKAGQDRDKLVAEERARVASERQRGDTYTSLLDEGAREGLTRAQNLERMQNAGLGRESIAYADETTKREGDTLRTALTAIGSHADDVGRATELFAQLKENPSLYPKLRTQLTVIANRVNPELAAMIPETMDSTIASNLYESLVPIAQKAGTEARALKGIHDALQMGGQNAESLAKMEHNIALAFSKADTPEERESAAASLIAFKVPEPIVRRLAALSNEEIDQLAMTPAQRAAADARAASATGFTLAPGARRYDSTGQLVATAPDRPTVSDGEKPITRAQRATAERFKLNELQQAEADFKKATEQYTNPLDILDKPTGQPVRIPAELIAAHEARKRSIQDSYLEQIGDTSVLNPGARRAGSVPPSRSPRETVADMAAPANASRPPVSPFLSTPATAAPPSPRTPTPVAPAAPVAPPVQGNPLGMTPGSGVVPMRTPDGRVVMVPAAQVEEAKRRGATVVVR